jgi:hypothetical protein
MRPTPKLLPLMEHARRNTLNFVAGETAVRDLIRRALACAGRDRETGERAAAYP